MWFFAGSQLSQPSCPLRKNRQERGHWCLDRAHSCGVLHTRCFSGPSGNGRPRWDWSCWLRRGTTRRCRGCSRRLISTTQACWAAWTARPQRLLRPPCTAACTGLLLRPTPSCSVPWCPVCSSTAWGPGGSRPSIPCPTPFQAPRTPGEERVTPPSPPCPALPVSGRPASVQPKGGSGEVRGGGVGVGAKQSQPSVLHPAPTPPQRQG